VQAWKAGRAKEPRHITLSELAWTNCYASADLATRMRSRRADADRFRGGPDDTELLYVLWGLYTRSGQIAEASEEVLRQCPVETDSRRRVQTIGDTMAETGKNSREGRVVDSPGRSSPNPTNSASGRMDVCYKLGQICRVDAQFRLGSPLELHERKPDRNRPV